MGSTSSASLGQLAVHAEVIPLEECQRLRYVLRARVKAGKPTSLGRLLLKGGLSSRKLRRLLRKGAHLDAVRCDVCGEKTPQLPLTQRQEYPCVACGGLILAFAPFAKRPKTQRLSGGPRDVPSQPVPGPDELTATIRYKGVLPLPSQPPPGLDRPTPSVVARAEENTLAYGSEDTTVRFNERLIIPVEDDVPSLDQTMHFEHVFRVPTAEAARSDEETITAFGKLVYEDESEEIPTGFRLPEPDLTDPHLGEDEADAQLWASSGLTIRTIGGLRLIDVLGEGSVGKVFLARDPTSRQLVALKVLRPEAAADPEYLRRFEREARAASRVNHPNVVRLVRSGRDEELNLHYLALEYVAGGSLQDLLKDTPIQPEQRALRLIRGVCLALLAAEKEGIVHRDIKPENILLTKTLEPKLADLGLAKQYDQSQITETGVVVGTPVYIAPEQAMGEVEIDIRADLFSLGFVLWQMLSGVLPFADDDAPPLEVIVRHLEQDLPDVRIYAPHVSDGVAQIVRGMTARDRERRYRSPSLIVRDIDLVLEDRSPLGPSDTTRPTEAAIERGSQRIKAMPAPAPLAETIAVGPPAGAVTATAQGSSGSAALWLVGCLVVLLGLAGAAVAVLWKLGKIHF